MPEKNFEAAMRDKQDLRKDDRPEGQPEARRKTLTSVLLAL
jgi:hypothetical protein